MLKGLLMPARVVIVHDTPEFLTELVAAVRLAGYDVTAFADPMIALNDLDADHHVDVLITRIQFRAGKPNGIALARMARVKCPGIRIVFTALPEFAQLAADLGTLIPAPIKVAQVVTIVRHLLASEG